MLGKCISEYVLSQMYEIYFVQILMPESKSPVPWGNPCRTVASENNCLIYSTAPNERSRHPTDKNLLLINHRDAKFPGILRAVNFHREYWEFCGNIGNFREYLETLGILE